MWSTTKHMSSHTFSIHTPLPPSVNMLDSCISYNVLTDTKKCKTCKIIRSLCDIHIAVYWCSSNYCVIENQLDSLEFYWINKRMKKKNPIKVIYILCKIAYWKRLPHIICAQKGRLCLCLWTWQLPDTL